LKTSSSTNSIWQLLQVLARTRFAPQESSASVISNAGNRRLGHWNLSIVKSFLLVDGFSGTL